MRFSFFLILSLLVVPGALGVGFANPPQQREFIFSPNEQFSVPIIVSNGQSIHAELRFNTNGNPETLGTPEDNNIHEYVKLVDPAPDTGTRQVQVQFNLPEQMKPGVYHCDLFATDQRQTGQGTVAAVATAKLRLVLRVLSPEKIVEINALSVRPVAQGLQANATVHVVSRTTQNIGRVTALLEVMDGEEVVATGASGPIGLASAQAEGMITYMDTESLAAGDYPVFVTVEYDGLTVQGGPSTLKIGTLHVDVVNHSESFLYNATNKFTFTVENEWNRELQDVFAFVELYDEEKKTASLNIPPFGKQEFEMYFDRDESLDVGTHNLNITIFFKDYDPVTDGYVDKEESFIRQIEVVLPVVEEESLPMGLISTGILVVIVFLVVLFLLLRKKPPEEEPAHEQTLPPSL